jgi:hypothetical protein
VIYREFNPDFRIGGDPSCSRTGGTTVAPPHLQVIKADGQSSDPWAFTESFNRNRGCARFPSMSNGGGYHFALTEFEKVPRRT